MSDLRGSETFMVLTDNGRCWVCGGVTALLCDYTTEDGYPDCCFVSIREHGFYRDCVKGQP